MKEPMRLMLITVLFDMLMIPVSVFADKQELVMDESRAIDVDVSRDGLSSVSVKGDRIKEVLGLSEEVSVEKDESNGLLFLRGVKNKENITILTEGGEMQDVVLKPSSKGSTRIILTMKQPFEQSTHPTSHTTPLSSQPVLNPASIHLQDMIISLMKQVHLGAGSPMTSVNRASKEGFSLTPIRFVSDQQWRAEVYEVKNLNDNTTHVLEKDFYERGDVAISLSKRQVKAGDTFYVYVVRLNV